MSIVSIIITLIILLIIAAISKAVMDTVDFKFNKSIFSKIKSEKKRLWFNQSQGWKNKYKNSDPEQGPAFPGSTTVFVFITDAWHFFQMIMLTCYQIAYALPIALIIGQYVIPITIGIILLSKFFSGTVFELFWDKIFMIEKD